MSYVFVTVSLLFLTSRITYGNPDLSSFSANNAKFATDFYSAIVGSNTNRNVVVSPFSVQICGAMLYAGAGKETAKIMAQGLKLFQNNKTAVVNAFKLSIENHTEEFVKIANKIYFAENVTVRPKFKRIVKEKFLSEEQNIDFSKSKRTARIINNWVKNATHNKIKKLFNNDAFNKDVFMTIVNTIYFKGDWAVPFKEAETGKFWISENKNKELDMMEQTDYYNIGVIDELNATVLQLEYENSDLSMLVLLPNNRSGLAELEKKLPNINLVELPKKLIETYANVILPKFKIEFSADLRDVFTKMGMGSIFENANFRNMIKGKATKIDKAVHEAFIETTELGTEAGAASGFSIKFYTIPTPIIADHPFIFTIVSKSAVLFLGRFVG